MLLALVSTMDSITSLPLPLRTAITIASLCTSMPIYLMSRLIPLPPWGIDHSRQRSLSLKVKCHSSADLPIFSSGSCPHPLFSPLNGPLSHNALTGHDVEPCWPFACTQALFREFVARMCTVLPSRFWFPRSWKRAGLLEL